MHEVLADSSEAGVDRGDSFDLDRCASTQKSCHCSQGSICAA